LPTKKNIAPQPRQREGRTKEDRRTLNLKTKKTKERPAVKRNSVLKRLGELKNGSGAVI